VDVADHLQQISIGAPAWRRVAVLGKPSVVGRRGDTEHLQNRCDPEAVFQRVDRFHHFFLVGSISCAKKALAALRI
jgi:hypothetical protein